MAGQAGRNLLLKFGTSGTAGTTVAALVETSFSVNGNIVDHTNKDSGGFRELVAGAGNSNWQVNASGKFDGEGTAHLQMIERAQAKSLDAYGLVFDDGDTLDGTFQIATFEGRGNDGEDQVWSVTLESHGSVTPAA